MSILPTRRRWRVSLGSSKAGRSASPHVVAAHTRRRTSVCSTRCGEAGIGFDIIGGTSGGAAMAAALALGVAPDDIEANVRDIFVTRQAMRGWTWPRYSLLDHTILEQALAERFAGIDVEDLAVPFFAVATNLSSGAAQCLRRGPLWRAIRASAAIPAMFPPVFTADGEMLVDGCLTENVPLRSLKALSPGPAVVIDLALPDERPVSGGDSDIPARAELVRRLLTGGARIAASCRDRRRC